MPRAKQNTRTVIQQQLLIRISITRGTNANKNKQGPKQDSQRRRGMKRRNFLSK